MKPHSMSSDTQLFLYIKLIKPYFYGSSYRGYCNSMSAHISIPCQPDWHDLKLLRDKVNTGYSLMLYSQTCKVGIHVNVRDVKSIFPKSTLMSGDFIHLFHNCPLCRMSVYQLTNCRNSSMTNCDVKKKRWDLGWEQNYFKYIQLTLQP